LTSFVVDSVGNEIENPRCAEQPVAPIELKPLHHISVMPGFGDDV